MPSPRDRLGRLLRPVRRAVLARRRLLAALLTAVAVASGVRAATAPPPPTVTVLTAVRDLPAGVVIGRGDLAATAFAPGSVPSGAAPDPVGRTLAAPLRRGEPVTDVRLVGPALTDGYPGLTALPVRLPDAGMAGLLRVGDRIDLVAADPQGSGAVVIASDVPVLAVPDAPVEPGTTGIGGRLVVIGADDAEVTRVADAAVRDFISIAYAH